MTSIIKRMGLLSSIFAFTIGCGEGDSSVFDTVVTESSDSSNNQFPSLDAGDETTSDTGQEQTGLPTGKYISIDKVYALAQEGSSDIQLINVSDVEFYSMGHITGSLKIPWDTLADNLSLVNASKHIILYCRRGVRSEAAYETLMVANYTSVFVMEGGLESWIAAGYPVVAD